nr:MAG TPA: hypothetical protein [Crassvirales sp.]
MQCNQMITSATMFRSEVAAPNKINKYDYN